MWRLVPRCGRQQSPQERSTTCSPALPSVLPILNPAEHPAHDFRTKPPNTALNCQRVEGELFSVTHGVLSQTGHVRALFHQSLCRNTATGQRWAGRGSDVRSGGVWPGKTFWGFCSVLLQKDEVGLSSLSLWAAWRSRCCCCPCLIFVGVCDFWKGSAVPRAARNRGCFQSAPQLPNTNCEAAQQGLRRHLGSKEDAALLAQVPSDLVLT